MPECKRCGKCCRWLLLHIIRLSDVDVEFVKARGLAVIQVDDEMCGVYATNMPCKHLNDDNTCAIYENRPESCKKYPEGRIYLLPECGYA